MGRANWLLPILGYPNANHTRAIPRAPTPAPKSISTALCGPASNPVPCPTQKSPTAIDSMPITASTIFMGTPAFTAVPRRLFRRSPPLFDGGTSQAHPNAGIYLAEHRSCYRGDVVHDPGAGLTGVESKYDSKC